MKTILLNDTSRFHHGSSAVMRVLQNEAQQAGLDVIETVFGNTWYLSKSYPLISPEALEEADLFILNGEGTMHDDGKLAVFFLQEIAANRGHRKLALVNSLWQRMSAPMKQVVETADLVILREPKSYQDLGLSSAMTMPDLSYFEVPVYARMPDHGRVKGTFYGGAQRDLVLETTMNISAEPWGAIVNKLRHAEVCVTGKHHEVLAACVARCPFVTTEIPTHKISGIGAYVDADLVVVAPDAPQDVVSRALEVAVRDANGTYQRLFDHMENLRETMQLRHIFQDKLCGRRG